MKSLLKKLVTSALIVALVLSVFSCVTFATGENTKDNSTVAGQVTDASEYEATAFEEKVVSNNDYKAYLTKYASAQRPDASIVLMGKDAYLFDKETGAIKEQVPAVKAYPLNNPTDEREGGLFYDEGICGWVFNVTKAGLYNITLSYFAYETLTYEHNGVQYTTESKSSTVQRKIYIDGEVPFYETRQVNFERVWKDASLIGIDSQTNNEKRPYQMEAPQWQTLSVRDYMGYEEEPFVFYFSEGTHTLTFEAIKEGFIIEKATLGQIEAAPTYAELVQEYEQKGYTKVTGVDTVYIQAEGIHMPEAFESAKHSKLFLTTSLKNKIDSYIDPVDTTSYKAEEDITYDILKSTPTLYAITDRSSPLSVPYHQSKIRYNTIGADKWVNPNEWIEWNVSVEKAGLYAINFKARQNTLNGMYTSRKLTINGEVPFKEATNLRFAYDNNFTNYTLGHFDVNCADCGHVEQGFSQRPERCSNCNKKIKDNEITKEVYYFYLQEGKNTIRLETTLGDLGALLAKAETSLTQLNLAYRKILMITGASPDQNRDYKFDVMVPDALKIINEEYQNLTALEQEFISVFGKGASSQLSSLKNIILVIEQMDEDYTRIGSLFTDFKDAIASMGTWINDVSSNPLELDYIAITTQEQLESNGLIRSNANFGEKLMHELRSFIASFTEDYDNIGGTVAVDGKEPVEVWIETGVGLTGSRDNATILKQLTDDMFTDKTGIVVSTRLVAAGSLLPSVLSGIGPEVCLARSAEMAVNYALRGAVMNLADEELFPDYKDVLFNTERFASSAVEPFTFGKETYGMPEMQYFYMVFYRTDILEELGLSAPKTWDDVYNIIGELQNQQMTFAMPVPIVGAVGSGNMTYAMMLYQKGGQYYNEERSTTTLTTDAALDAFKEWTQFYTLYNLPNTYDFANRFRTGEVPVGLATYSSYSQLAVFAPEIQGLWEFSMVPGTPQYDANGNPVLDENGNQVIDHSCGSTTTGCVMLSMDSSTEEGRERIKNAWEFMKWWTGEDAQYRFGTEIESLLGPAARYETANLKAFEKLPWDKTSMDEIREQWKHAKAVPQLPGGYYTARNIEFAWKEVINNKTDPNTTFVEYVSKINQEIARKREEFADKIEKVMGGNVNG